MANMTCHPLNVQEAAAAKKTGQRRISAIGPASAPSIATTSWLTHSRCRSTRHSVIVFLWRALDRQTMTRLN